MGGNMSAAAMNVEIRHLRAFASVAAHRSFTVASRELMIAQRPVELTDVGRRFLERVRRVLAEFDHAMAATSDERQLRLGFHWGVAAPVGAARP
jgi:DNA-binding transcriptional LysR family regulator